MPLVKDEQDAVANFAAAAGELIRTWGWQNPRTEPPVPEAYYHFINVKGKLTSGYLCEFNTGAANMGIAVVGDMDDCGRLTTVSPVLFKPMQASEVV